ncbi:ADP-ribosylglycohydrolase [Hexamita inflata]|uniref:ADP-ribosylhydrolase ARH3 n=1 Tax=Hexamita inflata TaxID=28002 RepID=A0AA86NXT4_9EUKA|nr:ADP-ribosylglycohydrolase [Hexamita inflata]
MKWHLAELRQKGSKTKPIGLELIHHSYLAIDKKLMKQSKQIKQDLINGTLQDYSPMQLRVIGAFFGTFIGDALGAPFEFLDFQPSLLDKNCVFNFPASERELEATFKSNPIKNTSKYCSNFNMRFGCIAGQWTDDAAQMMALLEVLTYYNGFFGSQLMFSIQDWYEHGYCIPYSKSLSKLSKKLLGTEQRAFGLGRTVGESLQEFKTLKLERTETSELKTKTGNKNSCGNGALMRNSACFYFDNVVKCVQVAIDQSLVTHQGFDSALCCAIHAYMGHCFIYQKNLDESGFVTFDQFYEILKELKVEMSQIMIDLMNAKEPRNWKKFGPPVGTGYFGGYAVDCLYLALHQVYNYNTVNLEQLATMGGDSDSNGAVAGALLGARYGINSFRENWVKAVLRFDDDNLCSARCVKAIDMCNVHNNAVAAK